MKMQKILLLCLSMLPFTSLHAAVKSNIDAQSLEQKIASLVAHITQKNEFLNNEGAYTGKRMQIANGHEHDSSLRAEWSWDSLNKEGILDITLSTFGELKRAQATTQVHFNSYKALRDKVEEIAAALIEAYNKK